MCKASSRPVAVIKLVLNEIMHVLLFVILILIEID